MSNKNKKIIATLLSTILLICVSLSGIVMARELYVNNTKHDLIFKDLEPQSTIRLDKSVGDLSSTPDYCVSSNSHEMLTNTVNDVNVISIWSNWDAYTPITQLERYTAANVLESNCGYDRDGNLKNAYLFSDIVSKDNGIFISHAVSDDSKLIEALKQKIINYASTRVTGTVVLSAETPLGYNYDACTIELSDTLLPAVIEIPRDSFSFPDDNAKWHLADSYRLTIEQGPNVYYYRKSSNPSASDIKEFADNYIISDKNYTGVSIVVTKTGLTYYYDGTRWTDNNLSAQQLKSNYISLKLRSNSNKAGPGYSLAFDIKARITLTSIKQTLIDTFDTNIDIRNCWSLNSITTDSQSKTITTSLSGSNDNALFLGIVDGQGNLLDGVYGINKLTDSNTSRSVYVNSGEDIFAWSARVSSMTMGGSKQWVISIDIKWTEREDTSVLYPVKFFLAYIPVVV